MWPLFPDTCAVYNNLQPPLPLFPAESTLLLIAEEREPNTGGQFYSTVFWTFMKQNFGECPNIKKTQKSKIIPILPIKKGTVSLERKFISNI